MALMEEMICGVFKSAMNIDLPNPFPQLPYAEAMSRYGSDKPDLRVPLVLTELTDVMREVEFKVFREAAQKPRGRVAALLLPGGGTDLLELISDVRVSVNRKTGAPETVPVASEPAHS